MRQTPWQQDSSPRPAGTALALKMGAPKHAAVKFKSHNLCLGHPKTGAGRPPRHRLSSFSPRLWPLPASRSAKKGSGRRCPAESSQLLGAVGWVFGLAQQRQRARASQKQLFWAKPNWRAGRAMSRIGSPWALAEKWRHPRWPARQASRARPQAGCLRHLAPPRWPLLERQLWRKASPATSAMRRRPAQQLALKGHVEPTAGRQERVFSPAGGPSTAHE